MLSLEGEGQIASYCMNLGSVPGNLTIFVFKFIALSEAAILF